MSLAQILNIVQQVLNYELFTLAGKVITPASVITFFVFIALAWGLSKVVRRAASRAMRARGIDDPGTRAIAERLLHYAVMAVGAGLALENLGINLATLFAAGAIFGVALGFAMQNIVQNFVSGLILLVERVIKPGDVLEVESQVVRVVKMGLRTTVARTRDEEEIIIPNATLVQGSVKNYTLRDSLYRVRAGVGVAYGSDLKRVMSALHEAGEDLEWRFAGRDPQVFLKEFGSSSVNFELSVWTEDPWGALRAVSDVNEAVWWSLKDAGVTIAFPQVDIHFDQAVTESLQSLPKAS